MRNYTRTDSFDNLVSRVECGHSVVEELQPQDALAEAQKLSWLHDRAAVIIDHKGRRRTVNVNVDRRFYRR